MNVAVILNSESHVETLVFLCLALERLPGITPVAFPLEGDRLGLKDLLEQCRIRYSFHTEGLESYFDVAVVVTAYPAGREFPQLPFNSHPFLKAFQGRRILVSHRANAPATSYESGNVVCLTPISERYGIPCLHPCENPILEVDAHPSLGKLKLLVQGRFGYKHRELKLIQELLIRFGDELAIVLLGKGASKCGIDDPRVTILENLTELEFYRAASDCDCVLPLISGDTRSGSYVKERFSSSLGIAFPAAKPSVVHESIQSIYPFDIGYSYRESGGLLETVGDLLDQGGPSPAKRKELQETRMKMREHNQMVLGDLLARVAGNLT